MRAFGVGAVIGALICVGVSIAPRAVSAQELSAGEVVSLAQLTPEEKDYYDHAANQTVRKNFIITRSYLRLAQKLVDKQIPPDAFPMRKPKGFSVEYLLPDDPEIINEAIGIALSHAMAKCVETNAPPCGKIP